MRKILNFTYRFKIFKRIIPSLLKVVIKLFNIKEIKIIHNNLTFLLNPRNPIDREIYLKDKYELQQLNFLTNIIENNCIQIFIDIGAHMGFYSINISKQKIKIYAFEPIIENYNQLTKNILINKIENINKFNCALSNVKKSLVMWVSNKDKTGGFSIYNQTDEELQKYEIKKLHTRTIESEIGDDLLNIKKSKIAIKIDVERHEEEVLLGIEKLLKNNEIIIQIEIFNERRKKIFAIFKSRNYHLINMIGKDYYFTNFKDEELKTPLENVKPIFI